MTENIKKNYHSEPIFIFFGTPEFAAIILKKIIQAEFIPQVVICNPDRPFGRKKIITPPPTKVLAQKYNIAVFQPENLKNFKFQIKNFINATPDLFIVAAYSQIISKDILEIPRFGTIGVHPSLLPKYRGCSPIQTVILNGEKETGVTLYLMDEKMDHGPILAQRVFPILDLSFSTLQQKLAELGADLLIEILPKFLKGEIQPIIQDETKASYTKKFVTEDGYVDLAKDEPIFIYRKIKALNPEPGVFTFQNGKRIKLLEAEFLDGKFIVTKTQVEGKKPQPAQMFLN